MFSLPINTFTNSNFYFSTFLFGASGLWLLALYLYRWKSNPLSFFLWSFALAVACGCAWFITGDSNASIFQIGINILLFLAFYNLAPTISIFGVFFLMSMANPIIYGLIWLYELSFAIIEYLKADWPLSIIILSAYALVSLLILCTAVMSCWINLVRYSKLYFLFPRLLKGWKSAQQPINTYPWVSLHVPCYSEPPEVVITTLNALAKQDYPHFEVIVIDNNTQEIDLWKPIEEHCLKLGERFRFFHFDQLKGAKAGALNKALQLTSPKVEIIGVLDADFEAKPDFLSGTIGFFNDPLTGFVQTCHNYREWAKNRYLKACYYEYEMHFQLELPGQNEWDAAYTVGTMCLIRRKALEEVGRWAEWCLTEDSELAVRLHAKGYSGYYLKDTFGRGLIPETFDGYKMQRFRWTAGPVQQFQKHWRLYLPITTSSRLTFIQKMSEVFHSMSLFFSEALYLVLNLPILILFLWLAIAKGQSFAIPLSLLMFILVGIMRNMICSWVYVRLLNGNWLDAIWSSIAGRSVYFTRYKAFYMAWLSKNIVWKRTGKFKTSSNYLRALSSSYSEFIAGVIYLVIVIAIAPFANYRQPDVLFLILLNLINQTFTFFCSPIMALLAEVSMKKK